ncbi:isotrichodermin C-15 hydroxylase [Massariosphaeria phaeospora]|uniref:Isotrichodermin C-15 hydroxylase n=1 Tax=Massariosphaeria phaeospora TaxID=100035 RepID=A0A7C8M7Z0_9PLEO|nr:isotrichodermin C-15 hydroxylase [Massariosphaeria phaeospora]
MTSSRASRLSLTSPPQSFISLLWNYVYNLHFHPLASYPGPKLWAASRIPHEYSLVRGRITRDLAVLHAQYGDVVRVTPTTLAYIHPDAWPDIYVRKPGQSVLPKDMKRYSYDLCINNAPESLTADEPTHSRLRRAMAYGFSEKALREQEPLVQSLIDLFINQMRKRAHDKIDISAWSNWATFDIVGELGFGETFGCLAKGEYHPWVALIFDGVKGATFLGAARQFPWLSVIFQRLVDYFFIEKLREHKGLAIEKVDRRLAASTDRNDIVGHIIQHDGSAKELSRDEIYSNLNLIIMGGSETSAAAISGCVYHLCAYPDMRRRLEDELRQFSSEKDITFESTSTMEFLDAFIHESMRKYPSQPISTPRVAPPGGCTVAGKYVPEGTSVGIYQSVAYNSARNFRDPTTFDPSRWLGNPKYESDRRDILRPFSVGHRNCIGKQLAYSEIRVILSRLVWNFDMALCEESRMWTDQLAYWIWARPPLMVKLTEKKV